MSILMLDVGVKYGWIWSWLDALHARKIMHEFIGGFCKKRHTTSKKDCCVQGCFLQITLLSSYPLLL